MLLHLLAGRLAARRAGAAEGVIASDVIEALPRCAARRPGAAAPGAGGGRWLTTLAGRGARGAVGAHRRAQASVNLAALERNCARMRRELQRRTRRCARSSRPTATATARCPAPARRSPAGPAGSRSPTPSEALELREGGLTEVPMLVMGALDAGELEQALPRAADVVIWREDQLRARARTPAADACT